MPQRETTIVMRKQQNYRVSGNQAQQRLSARVLGATILLNFAEQIKMDLLIEELAEIIEIEGGLLIP
jgi:hypothetical protein